MILHLVNHQLSSGRYGSEIEHDPFLSNVYNLLESEMENTGNCGEENQGY